MRNYQSARQIRRRNEQRLGFAILAFCVACTIGLCFAAYSVDQTRGISVDQSLRAFGL